METLQWVCVCVFVVLWKNTMTKQWIAQVQNGFSGFFSDPLYYCLFLLFDIFTAHFSSGEARTCLIWPWKHTDPRSAPKRVWDVNVIYSTSSCWQNKLSFLSQLMEFAQLTWKTFVIHVGFVVVQFYSFATLINKVNNELTFIPLIIQDWKKLLLKDFQSWTFFQYYPLKSPHVISYLLRRKIQYDISSMSACGTWAASVNRDPDDCPTSALSYQQKPSKEMFKRNCAVNERTFPSQTSQHVSLHNNKWLNSTSALCFSWTHQQHL